MKDDVRQHFTITPHTPTHPHTLTLAHTSQVTGEDLIHRSDDNEEALRTRLETYHSQTTPLVEFYSKHNLHTKVDASKKPEDVWKDVEAAVKSKK